MKVGSIARVENGSVFVKWFRLGYNLIVNLKMVPFINEGKAMIKAVGYNNVRHALIEELTKISKSSATLAKKNAAAEKAGRDAVTALWVKEDARKPDGKGDELHAQESGNIAATTHNRYVTRLRRDIEEAGFISFSFFDDLNEIKKSFPKHASKLENIDTRTYRTINKLISEILVKVEVSIKKSKRESTIKALVDFASALRELKTQNHVNVALIRHGTEKADMKKREEKRKVKYMKKQRKFYAVEVLSTIYKLLKSNDWQDLTIGIAAAIGRRCAEVVHFGEFSKANETEHYAIKFKGMRKSKVKEKKTFKIPTLIEADLVIDAIKRLRKTERIMSTIGRLKALKLHEAEFARQLNNSVHSQLNEHINEILNPKEKRKSNDLKWVFKDTRALYARMSYAVYTANAKKAGREPMLDTAYFKSVLLHTDLNETLSYMQFQLKDADIFGAHQIRRTRTDGAKLKFLERLPLLTKLSKSTEVTSRQAFTKYTIWCIEQLRLDEDVIFTTRLLRSDCGGRAETIGLFVAMLEKHQLNAPNLIKEAKKEKKVITKQVHVTMTVTYTRLIEIEYKEGQDEDSAIYAEISSFDDNDFYSSDVIDSDYDINEIVDVTELD